MNDTKCLRRQRSSSGKGLGDVERGSGPASVRAVARGPVSSTMIRREGLATAAPEGQRGDVRVWF